MRGRASSGTPFGLAEGAGQDPPGGLQAGHGGVQGVQVGAALGVRERAVPAAGGRHLTVQVYDEALQAVASGLLRTSMSS
jgi:hypothetical protein